MAAADAPAATPTAERPERAKAKRLEWQEQRDWRDGRSARLAVEGAAVAWYVSRKVRTESPRTMVLELDGGIGAKVWLNGNLVGEYAPPVEKPAPTDKPGAKTDKPDQAEEFDEEAFFAQRQERPEPRRLPLGLRAGDNYLAVKLIGKGAAPRRADAAMAMDKPPEAAVVAEIDADAPPAMQRGSRGGLSFSCRFKAEGDDLLDYETMQAMRIEAMAAPAPSPTSPPTAEASAAPTAKDAAAGDLDEIKKPKTPAERRQRALRRWFRTRIDIAGRVLFEELERLKQEKARVEAKLPSALVMEELKARRETRVFARGDYRKKGDLVAAGTPAVLPKMVADLPPNRLGLARWLVAPDHPLTWRVTVNRGWQQFFGRGIVRTADDFGIRGAPPSHRELLDWLATEFVRSGFKHKQLHRMVVLSATYRQANSATPESLARDPDNVLLARGPRLPLTAEMLRDQALFASDLLVQKVGGPSVKPYQPPGLWKSMLGAGEWKPDAGAVAHRRGLYVYWKRGVPYPSFTIFDAAKRETCTVTRTRTTTPLQALVTLNDPVYVEAGRSLGQRMLKHGGADDDARLTFGFRLVASRAPEARELAILRALLADQRQHFAADLDAAKQVLGIDSKAGAKGERRRGGKTTEPAAADKAAQAAAKGAADKAAAADAKGAADSGKAAAAAKPAGEDKPATEGSQQPFAARRKAAAGPEPAEAAAWAQIGCTLLNLEMAVRRG
jgi:hypothetical protein